MKHTIKITLILILLFLAAQIIGLLIVNKYLSMDRLPFDIERPNYDQETSYVPILFAIFIGTGLALLLARFKAVKVWKFWFFLSIFFTLIIAFGAFMNEYIALIFALVLAVWKVLRGNVIINNFTELFIYAGLAAIFVPVLNIWSASILLILISIYDMWAVWQSKHMVKLAEFQTDSKLFAGLNITYTPSISKKKISNQQVTKDNKKIAIIGGGDVAFPLLFAGAILKSYSFWSAIIVALFTSLALLFLLLYSKKDRYYPAMPFIAAGCFIGLLIVKIFF